MNISRSLKVVMTNLVLLFVASCALKIPAYVGVKTDQVSTIVDSDLYMSGLYYDSSSTSFLPSYWINTQRVTCDFPLYDYGATFIYPPRIAIDNSNDMFMAFMYGYGDANPQAGLCINRTFMELLPPADEEYDTIYSVDDIVEANGEVYVVGSILRNGKDCTGADENSDFYYVCPVVWKSSTDYTPSFLPIDYPETTSVTEYGAGWSQASACVDNGHLYVATNVGSSNAVGYWIDGVFYNQTSLFRGIAYLDVVTMNKIKVQNGVVYESGTYTTTNSRKINVFYIKNNTLFVIDAMTDTGHADLAGMQIVNNVVYLADNENYSSSVLIVGDKITTLSPKDATYNTYAWDLAVNSSGVAYVVGVINSNEDGTSMGAIWSTHADPKFYDNVTSFSGVAIK